MTRALFVAQLAITLPLVGLIWFVQIVAYPLFGEASALGQDAFRRYHGAHGRRITFVVLPLMLTELLASGAWLVWPPTGAPRGFAELAFALTVATWLVTGLISVPRHDRLARGFDPKVHASLVTTNWLRTLAWTTRGAMLLWLAAR